MNTIPNTILPRWNDQGLIPVITQDATSGDVLMLAWMNEEAMALTFAEGRAVYWSRSRAELWRKGDTSGHVQEVVDARLDCDGDTLLLKVNQHGAACHTGRPNCFFYFHSEGQWLAEEGDHS